MPVITMKPVMITVGRDMGNMCAMDVYAHEVPILKLIHGENKVVFEKDLDVSALGGKHQTEAREELIRLKRKYVNSRDTEGNSPIDSVFPDGSNDLIRFYSGAIPPVAVLTVSTNETIDPVGERVISRQDMMDELTKLGVEFAKTLPTNLLKSKLDQAKLSNFAEKDMIHDVTSS